MQLASIKPDLKYKRKHPDNKCLITLKFGTGQMELLDLYEQCVEPDPEEKVREERKSADDPLMQRKMDFVKRNACNFENLQSGQKSSSSAQLLLSFNDKSSVVKFSELKETLVLRNRTDIMMQKKRMNNNYDIQYVDKKCIRLFPRYSTNKELEEKK